MSPYTNWISYDRATGFLQSKVCERQTERETMCNRERRQCILQLNSGSDVPILLPYSVDHTDQSWYNVRWEYTSVNTMRWGISGAISEASYHRHYLHFGQDNYLLSRNILGSQGCLAFLFTSSLCPIAWNERRDTVKIRNSTWHFKNPPTEKQYLKQGKLLSSEAAC